MYANQNYVSPYLQRPLRSYDQVLCERAEQPLAPRGGQRPQTKKGIALSPIERCSGASMKAHGVQVFSSARSARCPA